MNRILKLGQNLFNAIHNNCGNYNALESEQQAILKAVEEDNITLLSGLSSHKEINIETLKVHDKEYLVIPEKGEPYYDTWSYDNVYEEGMKIFDLQRHTFTVDGKNWKDTRNWNDPSLTSNYRTTK